MIADFATLLPILNTTAQTVSPFISFNLIGYEHAQENCVMLVLVVLIPSQPISVYDLEYYISRKP